LAKPAVTFLSLSAIALLTLASLTAATSKLPSSSSLRFEESVWKKRFHQPPEGEADVTKPWGAPSPTAASARICSRWLAVARTALDSTMEEEEHIKVAEAPTNELCRRSAISACNFPHQQLDAVNVTMS
jgi:hypothetical protein